MNNNDKRGWLRTRDVARTGWNGCLFYADRQIDSIEKTLPAGTFRLVFADGSAVRVTGDMWLVNAPTVDDYLNIQRSTKA